MAKWKCEICGNEFDNFHAQGFDNKIYCPLCYFKKENQELKKQLEVKKIIARNWEVDCKRNISEVEEKETQQKEFMKWLESIKFIGIIPIEIVCDKYKEIIEIGDVK